MKARRFALALLALSGGLSCLPSPEHPSEPAPIRYDTHLLADRQDVSGPEWMLFPLRFDAYVPRAEQWTAAREEQLRQSIRVAHVSTRTEKTPQVSFTAVEGREDLRQVEVHLGLDRPGAWAIRIAGPHVAPASSDPLVQAHYDFLAPQALGSSEDPSPSVPHEFLRSVGACEHVYKLRTRSDSNRVLRWVELFFSEGGLMEDLERNFTLDLFDLEGRHLGRQELGAVRTSPDKMEFMVPARAGTKGRLRITLGNVAYRPLAGGFTQDFSCEPAAPVLEVGYDYGNQTDVELLFSPIARAMELAFDGPK